VLCPSCKKSNRAGAKFCDNCGTPLRANSSAKQSDYTPAHLREAVLNQRSALEGEHKLVTVLFVDIKDSLKMAEQMDPEAWHGLLDRFFSVLTEAIHRFDGTINQYTGDGVMALFGAPRAQEDHARRACCAGLYMRRGLQALAAELLAESDLEFTVRLGLSSGPVVVGKIGDGARLDYTAQGPTVALAARMEALAGANQIYLSESTAKLVEGYHLLTNRGRYRIKGIDERVLVFELRGVGSVLTRFAAMREQGLSPFTGREQELQTLKTRWQEASTGQGGIVTIAAEAGVGKSRICYEFTQWCQKQDIPVFSAQGVSYGQGMALLPVLEFIRGYFGLNGEESYEQVSDAISDRLQRLAGGTDVDLSGDTEVLLKLLVREPGDSAAASLPNPNDHGRMMAAARRLLLAGSQLRAAVFLIEDLHLFDSASLLFMNELVGLLKDTPNMLLVNYRSEYIPRWPKNTEQLKLELRPLGQRAARDLTSALLGDGDDFAALIERIVSRSGGNPFFIEAVIAGLYEDGALKGNRGRYRQTRAIDELKIPGQIQTVLAARIDRLDQRAKHIAQVLAVAGRDTPESLLAEIADEPREVLRTVLDELVDDGLLTCERLYPEPTYSFTHLLAEEVVYGTQLQDVRRATHARVARSLELRYRDRLRDRVAIIARHWEQAGEADKAIDWYRQAANYAAANDIGMAMSHWHRVLVLLNESKGGPGEIAVQAHARLLHLGARQGLNDAEIKIHLDAGLALAAGLSAEQKIWHAYLLMAAGSAHAFAGRQKESLDWYRQAREIAMECDDDGARLVALVGMLYAELSLGHLKDVRRLAKAGIKVGSGDLNLGKPLLGRSPLLTLMVLRGWAEIEVGDLVAAHKSLDMALEKASANSENENRSLALAGLAMLSAVEGNHEVAEQQANESLRSASTAGNRLAQVYSLMILAYNACHEADAGLAINPEGGDWQAALARVDTALNGAQEAQVGLTLESRLLVLKATALAERGDINDARASARQALLIARERNDILGEAEAQLGRARVRRLGYGRSAKSVIDKALDAAARLADEAGAELLGLKILEERGYWALANDDQTSAKSWFKQARDGYGKLGAPLLAQRLSS